MDAFILKGVDKVFDWLQEHRGVVLPSALWHTAAAVYCAFSAMVLAIIFFNQIFSNLLYNVFWGMTLVLIWSTYLYRNWVSMKAWKSDSERFDDPKLKQRYELKALFEREKFWFLRDLNLFVVTLLFAVGLSTIDSAKGHYLPINTFDLLFFLVYSIHEYVKCVIPKNPVRRTQTRLVPISVRFQ